MSLVLALFLNYVLQYYVLDIKYWQAQYAQIGKHLHTWVLKNHPTLERKNTPKATLLVNMLPYILYLFLACFLQSNDDDGFSLGILVAQLVFAVLGVIHITIPEVGPQPDQPDGKAIEITKHYFKEIYLKTFLPLVLIFLPAGYILLALYFNIRFLLHQNIVHLPLDVEDLFEKIIIWVEEKAQLIPAVLFAIISYQEDVWQGIRWRYARYQDFLYQILYHASPMVTKIDFQNSQKSHVYKNTTLILKRSLWGFFILFIVRGFFS